MGIFYIGAFWWKKSFKGVNVCNYIRRITYDTDDYRLQVDPAKTRINDVCMTFAMTIDTCLLLAHEFPEPSCGKYFSLYLVRSKFECVSKAWRVGSHQSMPPNCHVVITATRVPRQLSCLGKVFIELCHICTQTEPCSCHQLFISYVNI